MLATGTIITIASVVVSAAGAIDRAIKDDPNRKK